MQSCHTCRAKQSGLCCYCAQQSQGFLLCLLVLRVEVPCVTRVHFLLALRGNYLSKSSRGKYRNYYLGTRASLMARLKRLQNPETVFLSFHWERRGV